MKPDLKCDPEIQIQRFLSYYFHNNWTWFTEQKGFPPSVTLLKTSPDFVFVFAFCIFMPYRNLKFIIPLEPIMFPFLSAYPDFFI